MICPATVTDQRVPCTLSVGHDHLHRGGGWVWWHGNGEACPRPDCHCSKDSNPEHDPGDRPNRRTGSFLDKHDQRGLSAELIHDPIATTTGATPLGNIPTGGIS